MEQNLNNSTGLVVKHIKEPTLEIVRYIDDRRKGIVKSLKTRWSKFNKQCMGGIEPNTIYSIAGISGSGKSAFANSLESDLFELNKTENFVVLSFNFEMLASKQIGRKLSYALKKTTAELYSGTNDEKAKLSNSDYDEVVTEARRIEKFPIYYVDRPGTVDQIRNTILEFFERPDVKGKWVLIFLDHTLLTRGREGEQERETLFNLQRMFMEMKKFGKTTIIQLSQMNRNIESTDRLNNSSLHFPMRSDIFGGKRNILYVQTYNYI